MSHAQAVARGPLNLLLATASGQWAVLGLGAAVLVWPEQFLATVQPFVRRLLVAGNIDADSLLVRTAKPAAAAAQAPIIIHTSNSHPNTAFWNSRNSFLSMLTSCALGAGFVWVSYTLAATCLPEYLKELFPVTRACLNQVSTKLADGIFQVKEVLGKQILLLTQKQDLLNKKQDETHEDVRDIKEDLGHARGDLRQMGESLERCESSLEHAEHMQSYTARGVRLLVRSVASILPDNDNSISRDLLHYAKDGEQVRRLPDNHSTGTPATAAGSTSASTPYGLPSTSKPPRYGSSIMTPGKTGTPSLRMINLISSPEDQHPDRLTRQLSGSYYAETPNTTTNQDNDDSYAQLMDIMSEGRIQVG